MRSRLLVALAVILASLLVIPLTASGDDGRDGGSTPGPVEPSDSITLSTDVGTDDVDGNRRHYVGVIGNNSIDGSLCVGFDCVAEEAFGFDTFRLKENNLRINFEDTSSTGAFPSRDWRIVINSSANGGGSYFAVEDSTAGYFPFLIDGDAKSNALVVDEQGDVGIGTRHAALDLQITRGDTPSIRLQQDGTSGFTPQIWDLAGNEAGFFLRDSTNGSQLPLRVRPGAESSSIDVGTDSQIGLGTASARAKVHIQESDDRNGSINEAALIIENTSGVKKPRHMLYIVDNGASTISFEDTSAALNWFFGTTLQGDFRIGYQGAGGSNLLIEPSGEVTALADMNATAFNVTSDRSLKTAVTPVDPASVLAAVTDLPVSTWSFIGDGDVRHVGPMAQDFASAFGLGESDTSINVADAAGVSLAAIQALAAENRDLAATNADLQARIEALEAQMAQLLGG